MRKLQIVLAVLLCLCLFCGCTNQPQNQPDKNPNEEGDEKEMVNLFDKIDDRHLDKVTEIEQSEVYDLNVLANSFVGLHRYFGDGCILQRNIVNQVFGTCKYANRVTVELLGKYYVGEVSQNAWTVYLPPMSAGGPYKMTVYTDVGKTSVNVYFGDVFICAGQSNMEWTMSQCQSSPNTKKELEDAENTNIRLMKLPFDVSEEPLTETRNTMEWVAADSKTVYGFSCAGYLFGKYYNKETNIPVGLVSTAIGGTALCVWQSQRGMDKLAEQGIHPFEDKTQTIFNPTVGYNALISPLERFNYRGVLWYQGETNGGDFSKYGYYEKELQMLIDDWRLAFDCPEMVFVLYELARFEALPVEYAYIREKTQLVAKQDRFSCLVVNHDLGEYSNIHPNDKTELSRRAVRAVMETFCGVKNDKPYLEIESVKRDSEKQITLTFCNVGEGIILKNYLAGMEVSSDGQIYYDVTDYTLDGEKLAIRSDDKIAWIRYGYHVKVVGAMFADVSLHVSLYNSYGMPLDQFVLKVD